MIQHTRLAKFLVCLGISFGICGYSAPSAVDDHVAKGRVLLLSSPAEALVEGEYAHQYASSLPRSPERVLALATADWLRSAAYLNLNRLSDARRVVDGAINGGISRVAPGSNQFGDLLIARAVVARSTGDVEQALRDSLRAYLIFQQTKQKRSQAIALSSIATIHLVARDNASALRYYAQALEAYQADPALLVTILANRGGALNNLGRYEDARRELERGILIARRQNSIVLEGRILGDLATTQMLAGSIADADQSVRRGLALLKSGEGGDWTGSLLGAAAQLEERRRNYAAAAQLVERVFAGRRLDETDVMLRPFLQTGYRAFKATGNIPRALEYLEAYKVVDDRARSLAASANAALMSARFDFANQQARIAQLQVREASQQSVIQQGQARMRSIVMGALLIATFIVTALLLIGIVSIRRSRDRERAANEDLSASNAQLEHALAARTEFLATTSHEIRTPLNGILGMTQVLLADRSVDASVRERIQLVQGSGLTMKALVDDILDMAKMSTGEVRIEAAEMNLPDLLREATQVWEGQAAAKGISIVLEPGELPTRIIEDEVRLRQIVFNLMANAIKFTDRGIVRLSAEATPIDPDEPVIERRLRVNVADTGIGIPQDQLEQVFESFRQVNGGTTRRHGGTGLGLAICRTLARAMGGDVTVSSILGTGTTFVLDLPLNEVPVVVRSARKALPTSLAEARLMLIEPNPLTQSVLKAVLSPHVAGMDVAMSIDAAAETLAGMDIVLTDAASFGTDLAAAGRYADELKAVDARLVLLWPAPDAAIEAAAAQAGVSLLIAKPIQPGAIPAALAAVFPVNRVLPGIAA